MGVRIEDFIIILLTVDKFQFEEFHTFIQFTDFLLPDPDFSFQHFDGFYVFYTGGTLVKENF